MRWGKFILSFQAIATLIIGLSLLIALFSTNSASLKSAQETYNLASYVLINVSLIELIIIMRLVK